MPDLPCPPAGGRQVTRTGRQGAVSKRFEFRCPYTREQSSTSRYPYGYLEVFKAIEKIIPDSRCWPYPCTAFVDSPKGKRGNSTDVSSTLKRAAANRWDRPALSGGSAAPGPGGGPPHPPHRKRRCPSRSSRVSRSSVRKA